MPRFSGIPVDAGGDENLDREQGAVARKPRFAGTPVSPLTDEDRASPLPDALVEDGKKIIEGAGASFEETWMRTYGAKGIKDREAAEAAQKGRADKYGGSRFDAATEGSRAGVFGGYDDELAAAMLAPIDAAIDYAKGDGFDIGKAYTRKQAALDEQKGDRRAAYPTESLIGETVGGLALGGTLQKNGVTVAGRDLPIVGKAGASIAEGAGYGALYGSGEAKPGERLSGAGWGAAAGAAAGGALEAVGGVVSKLLAKKNGTALPAALTSKELKSAAGDMFDASEASGVTFKPESVDKLGKRLTLAAGRVSDKLRPKTSGYVDEIGELFSGKMSLEDFEEFRQVLGKEIRSAGANDARTLISMKRVLDDFADTANSADLDGNANGIKLLRKARETWATAKKVEIIENVLDSADVKTGSYTQSGLANTIRQQMEGLYKQIQSGKVKGFNEQEVKLVRQMAKGGSSSKIVNLMARFAPRGPVSITLGQILGAAVPGGNLVVPLVGAAAGAAKDKAAIAGVDALRDVISAGGAPAQKELPNLARPFIAGGAVASTEVTR